jgi:hypothetical protein
MLPFAVLRRSSEIPYADAGVAESIAIIMSGSVAALSDISYW